MVNIQTYENDKQPTFKDTDGLPYYGQIINIDDWQGVLSNYQQLKIQLAPHKILLILDDVHQCDYTSMHASMQDNIDFDDSECMQGIDFDDPVQERYFNIKSKALRTQHIIDLLQKQDSLTFNFLCDIYSLNEQTKEQLNICIKSNNYLVLPYSESPSEFLHFYE